MPSVDVHHHVQSPIFTEAMGRAGCVCSVPAFNLTNSHGLCEKFGITTAILSHTAPGPEIEKDAVKSAALARHFNEFCASRRDQEPQRYGFFASVPSLHDTERCVEEIAYALDILNADGVILFTSYTPPARADATTAGQHRVSYLGDPAFAPVWQELNRRRAVVLVHPTYTPNLLPANDALPVTMLDFSHETTRTALDLVVSNTLRDQARECKIILAHGGGTLASVVERVAVLGGTSGKKSAAEVRREVGWFYYDTALCDGAQVDAVRRIAEKEHILFGSDLPNAPVDAVEHFVGNRRGDDEGEAARVLFPRLCK